MIAKVKKLSERSHEGVWLRRVNTMTYIFLGLTGAVFIGTGVGQALNYQPLTMSYVQFFILCLYVVFVGLTSAINLVKLTKWIHVEARDSKSKMLAKIKRKNGYIVANVIFITLFNFAFCAYTLLYYRPRDYLSTFMFT